MSDRNVISPGDAWRVTVQQYTYLADQKFKAELERIEDGVAFACAATASEAAEIIDRVWSAPNGGYHRVTGVEHLGALWKDNQK